MQRVGTHLQGFKAFIGLRSGIKLDFISIFFLVIGSPKSRCCKMDEQMDGQQAGEQRLKEEAMQEMTNDDGLQLIIITRPSSFNYN